MVDQAGPVTPSEQQAVPVAQEDLELAELIVSRTRGFGVKLRKTDSRAIDIARHRLAALTSDALAGAGKPIDATQTREAELVAALTTIAKEAVVANEVIRLNRDGGGQGRIRVATAMHRIDALSRAALNARGGA